MDELAEAQARLADAQARTEKQVGRLADVTQWPSIRTDEVVGRTFELQFRDRLTAYLGRFLRRGKVVGNDTLLDAIEPLVGQQWRVKLVPSVSAGRHCKSPRAGPAHGPRGQSLGVDVDLAEERREVEFTTVVVHARRGLHDEEQVPIVAKRATG